MDRQGMSVKHVDEHNGDEDELDLDLASGFDVAQRDLKYYEGSSTLT